MYNVQGATIIMSDCLWIMIFVGICVAVCVAILANVNKILERQSENGRSKMGLVKGYHYVIQLTLNGEYAVGYLQDGVFFSVKHFESEVEARTWLENNVTT